MSALVDLDLCLAALVAGSFLLAMPWLSRESPRVRGVIYWISVYLLLRYLIWRVTVTLPPLNWTGPSVSSYLYFGFELWVGKQALSMAKLSIRSKHRSAEADAHMTWYASRARAPLVDYLIPTYNENHQTLERAIVGALSQDYERVRVWVLDDGRREWLRKLAAAKGVNYLTRPDNAGFKAGNLNYALSHIAALAEPSEFFAVLDCDFLAKPEFVRRTLALMWDETVAIVQSKQIYFNLDPFQYALPFGRYLPDWQRYAFDFLAPCKDVGGGQTCCGTCFLARTSSFELIGGMPTESVAEDALATYALNEHGLKTIYLSEGLSYGIVAEGLTEFLTQCGRWCFGRVQNVYSRWAGMSPSKSFRARYAFIESTVTWSILTIAKIVQMWLPIFYWFFGYALFPVHGTNEGFIRYFFIMWLYSTVAGLWLSRGAAPPIVVDSRQLLWASVVIRATARALGRSKNFRFDVTDKGVLRSRTFVHWKPLKWLLLVGGLTIAGLFYRAFGGYPPTARNYDAFAYFWSYYNLLCLATAIALCIEPAQRREQERFGTNEPAKLELDRGSWPVELVNLSVSGALLKVDDELTPNAKVQLDLKDVGCVNAVVVRATRGQLAVELHANEAQRESLIRKVYSEAYVRPILIGNVWNIYRGILAGALMPGAKRMGQEIQRRDGVSN